MFLQNVGIKSCITFQCRNKVKKKYYIKSIRTIKSFIHSNLNQYPFIAKQLIFNALHDTRAEDHAKSRIELGQQ